MSLPEIQISGNGMDITDAIRTYIEDKITKYERIYNICTSIRVECTEHVAARGVDKDFKIDITMHLPKAIARVEKSGSDVYALVDETTDILARKVKRYKDKFRQWEGKSPWKVDSSETDATDIVDDTMDYVNYSPKITQRFVMDDSTPMYEAEAIEHMELLGKECFLFKHKEKGIFCMVYKISDGEYGIVEPREA
ncbi:ribosome-associated translation inhibitor RaiA [Candidatus Dojkabacteria bacterium]|nr:ribosome-associated translation inhibitor RaiA [Candidatus Dojkabacteria bacterium]